MNSRGTPAELHKCDIKVANALIEELPANGAKLSGAGVRSCVREWRSDDCPNHMTDDCVDRRLVPVRECATEYRFAPHRGRDGAEDSRQRQERGRCLPEALTAEGGENGQKDKSEYDAEHHLPRISLRRDCALLHRRHSNSSHETGRYSQ